MKGGRRPYLFGPVFNGGIEQLLREHRSVNTLG